MFSTYVRLRPLSEGPSPVLPAPRSLQPSAARAAVSATIHPPPAHSIAAYAVTLPSTENFWRQAFYLLALVSIASLLPALKEEHSWTDADMFSITALTTFGTAASGSHDCSWFALKP